MDKMMEELIKSGPIILFAVWFVWNIFALIKSYINKQNDIRVNQYHSNEMRSSDYKDIIKEVIDGNTEIKKDHLDITQNIKRLHERLKNIENEIMRQKAEMKVIQMKLEETMDDLHEINTYLEDLAHVIEMAITHNDDMTMTAKQVVEKLSDFNETQKKLEETIKTEFDKISRREE